MRRILSPHMILENFGLTLVSFERSSDRGREVSFFRIELIARLEMISSYQHKHDVTVIVSARGGIMPSWSSYIVS